jgi:hypothetical protein
MSPVVSRRDVADIRLIVTDHPPVNALGQAVRGSWRDSSPKRKAIQPCGP